MAELSKNHDAQGQDDTAKGGAVTNTDPLLVDWLNQMEAFGYVLDLTLMVGGFIVGGTPTFLPEFLERQGAMVEDIAREAAQREPSAIAADRLIGFGEALHSGLSRDAETLKLPEAAPDDAAAQQRLDAARAAVLARPREHVMLKRASIITPEGQQLDVPFWRGRLAHVSGWWFGRWSKHDYEGIDPVTAES